MTTILRTIEEFNQFWSDKVHTAPAPNDSAKRLADCTGLYGHTVKSTKLTKEEVHELYHPTVKTVVEYTKPVAKTTEFLHPVVKTPAEIAKETYNYNSWRTLDCEYTAPVEAPRYIDVATLVTEDEPEVIVDDTFTYYKKSPKSSKLLRRVTELNGVKLKYTDKWINPALKGQTVTDLFFIKDANKELNRLKALYAEGLAEQKAKGWSFNRYQQLAGVEEIPECPGLFISSEGLHYLTRSKNSLDLYDLVVARYNQLREQGVTASFGKTYSSVRKQLLHNQVKQVTMVVANWNSYVSFQLKEYLCHGVTVKYVDIVNDFKVTIQPVCNRDTDVAFYDFCVEEMDLEQLPEDTQTKAINALKTIYKARTDYKNQYWDKVEAAIAPIKLYYWEKSKEVEAPKHIPEEVVEYFRVYGPAYGFAVPRTTLESTNDTFLVDTRTANDSKEKVYLSAELDAGRKKGQARRVYKNLAVYSSEQALKDAYRSLKAMVEKADPADLDPDYVLCSVCHKPIRNTVFTCNHCESEQFYKLPEFTMENIHTDTTAALMELKQFLGAFPEFRLDLALQYYTVGSETEEVSYEMLQYKIEARLASEE